MKQQLTLNVNGVEQELEVETHHTLLWILREHLKLYSVREGCGVGMCGACTVLVDGKPISTCLLFAAQVRGREIVTVEGLSDGDSDELHPIQEAYIACSGFQCSFCTPGFILTSKALLEEKPDATESEIREYLSGNLCRCGSYVKIMDSVKLAQKQILEQV